MHIGHAQELLDPVGNGFEVRPEERRKRTGKRREEKRRDEKRREDKRREEERREEKKTGEERRGEERRGRERSLVSGGVENSHRENQPYKILEHNARRTRPGCLGLADAERGACYRAQISTTVGFQKFMF